jgi:hypothetical protein
MTNKAQQPQREYIINAPEQIRNQARTLSDIITLEPNTAKELTHIEGELWEIANKMEQSLPHTQTPEQKPEPVYGITESQIEKLSWWLTDMGLKPAEDMLQEIHSRGPIRQQAGERCFLCDEPPECQKRLLEHDAAIARAATLAENKRVLETINLMEFHCYPHPDPDLPNGQTKFLRAKEFISKLKLPKINGGVQ